ncbi:hypothetical protein AB0D04_36605 [Streptomyces sp. NPDC048483]|uniref:hypothetical protein n=1 Tax=Streptomyces sp. NPDC048483 TaxID=3154927 RepID=UPI0034240C33
MTANSAKGTAHSRDSIAIFAGQGRTGRRAADLVAALLPPAVLVVTGLLVRARLIDDDFVMLNWVSLALSALVSFCAHIGWHARLHDGGLLSVRTLTGRRTVDLARLTKVGRIEVVAQGPTDDRLILTDAHGVRVILNKLKGSHDTVDATVRRALLHKPANAGVTVSGRAAERLDLEAEVRRPRGRFKAGRRIPFSLIGFAPLLVVPVYLLLAFVLTYGGVLLADTL